MLKRYGPLDWNISNAGGGNFTATNRDNGVSLTGTMSQINALIASYDVNYAGVVPSYMSSELVGDGRNMTIALAFKSNAALGAIAGGAALGLGKLVYTFPAGEILVNSISMNVGIKQTQGNITADTPDLGIGTTVAAGAVATLDGTAAFENIITGQTMTDCDGTKTLYVNVPNGAVPFKIATGDNHTVYLNVAATWTQGAEAPYGDAGALLQGEIVINWMYFS